MPYLYIVKVKKLLKKIKTPRNRVKTSSQLLLLISLNKGKLIEASMKGLAVIEIIFSNMDYFG